jgi:hypothetical protein
MGRINIGTPCQERTLLEIFILSYAWSGVRSLQFTNRLEKDGADLSLYRSFRGFVLNIAYFVLNIAYNDALIWKEKP